MWDYSDTGPVWLSSNFGRQIDGLGRYDYGSTDRGETVLTVPTSGSWTVGCQLWLDGSRSGLNRQSYHRPAAIRNGETANTRWRLRFKEMVLRVKPAVLKINLEAGPLIMGDKKYRITGESGSRYLLRISPREKLAAKEPEFKMMK